MVASTTFMVKTEIDHDIQVSIAQSANWESEFVMQESEGYPLTFKEVSCDLNPIV